MRGVAVKEEQHAEPARAMLRPLSRAQLCDEVTRPLAEDLALHRSVGVDKHAVGARERAEG